MRHGRQPTAVIEFEKVRVCHPGIGSSSKNTANFPNFLTSRRVWSVSAVKGVVPRPESYAGEPPNSRKRVLPPPSRPMNNRTVPAHSTKPMAVPPGAPALNVVTRVNSCVPRPTFHLKYLFVPVAKTNPPVSVKSGAATAFGETIAPPQTALAHAHALHES